MSDAASSFLNHSPRKEQQARDARLQAEQERRRRLELHGGDFCNRVLAGAFERVYQPDGSFRLREIQSGIWVEDLPPDDRSEAQRQTPPPPAPPSASPPGQKSLAMNPVSHAAMIEAAQRLGYASAVRELAHWISAAAIHPRMDARTLDALNAQLSQMSECSRSNTTMAP